MQKPFLVLLFILFFAAEISVAQTKIILPSVVREKVALKTAHNTYLCNYPFTGIMYTGSNRIGGWEIFTLERTGKSYENCPVVILKTCHNTYVTPGGTFLLLIFAFRMPAKALDTSPNTDHEYVMRDCGNGYVAFQCGMTTQVRTPSGFRAGTDFRSYLGAEPGPWWRLMSCAEKIDIWEKFLLIKNPVAARSSTASEDEEETETIKYDAHKDAALVAVFEKVAKAGQQDDAAGLLGMLPAKALKKAVDEIRSRVQNAQTKAWLEKIGITADDMKLEDKSLLVKYATLTMKMGKQLADKSEAKGERKIEVLATKIDGDTAFAKVKYTCVDGSGVEMEHKLVKEDGVWVIDEDFSIAGDKDDADDETQHDADDGVKHDVDDETKDD